MIGDGASRKCQGPHLFLSKHALVGHGCVETHIRQNENKNMNKEEAVLPTVRVRIRSD